MPIFSALALPGIAAAAAAAAIVESALLIALLLVRSTRVPRALLLCVILQGGLVVASVVGAAIVDRLTPSIEQLVRSTPDPGGAEQAQILTAVERYSAVVRGASQTLAWGWGAMRGVDAAPAAERARSSDVRRRPGLLRRAGRPCAGLLGDG